MGRTTPRQGARPKRLTAAWRGVREGRPEGDDGREGDPDVVALTEEPFTSVGETHRRLADLQREFATREDGRAVFLAVYARTTGEIADRISRGEFEDCDWVADYLVTFANYYREAAHRYEVGDFEALADPWQLAFETAEAADSLVVEDALLGINAHINYDLALALDEVGIRRDRPAKYEDHRAVTDVLRHLVDGTQEMLAAEFAPGIAAVDEALGGLDERLAIFTIAECRDSAWRNAVAMNSRFRLRRRLARWITYTTSTGTAHLIRSTRASATVHESLQDIEDGAR